MIVVIVLATGCGRFGFDRNQRVETDAPVLEPMTIRLGNRPGATDLGVADTWINSNDVGANHGADPGLQVDLPDFALYRFELPAAMPSQILAAELHLGVTDDRLEAGVVEVFEMKVAWSELGATWNEASPGIAWPAPGAAGASRAAIRFGAFDAAILFTDDTIAVPTDVIARWWSGANFGIGLDVTAAGVNLGVHEDPTNVDLRPELRITYVP